MKNPHPGQLFRLWLASQGMHQERAADLMKVSRLTVNQIINEHRSVTARMAIRLQRLTNVGAYMWMITQIKYDLEKARKEKW